MFLLYFVNAFQASILYNLLPFVTSEFETHLLLTVIYIVANSISAAVYIPLAKILDVWDRAEGFLLMMSASPEPLRSRPRRVDRKFAGPTAEKRKTEDTEEGANKRPRAGYGLTETTASPTKVLKGDGEWAGALKRSLKSSKYSPEHDLTDLRFEPAQQILSRPLGRGSDPTPYFIIIAREARFNLRHFEDNARHTVYILKISVHAEDKTQPLSSMFKFMPLDPKITFSGRQTVSRTKEQACKAGIGDTIVVRNPVTKDMSHSATTSSHDGGKKVSPATVAGRGSIPTASSSTGRGKFSMTGVSNGSHQLPATALASAVPSLRLWSAPRVILPQANQSRSTLDIDDSKEPTIDLTADAQASSSPKPKAQPYTDTVITKVAELIAGYSQPTRRTETHTSALPSTTSAETQKSADAFSSGCSRNGMRSKSLTHSSMFDDTAHDSVPPHPSH